MDNKYKEELKSEFDDLSSLLVMINSDEFKKHITKEMERYKDELRSAYDCDTMEELKEVKGKKHAVDHFFGILQNIRSQFIAKQDELDRLDRKG